MENFRLSEGNPPVTGQSPANDAELWWNLWPSPEKNGWSWANDAGNLRQHRAHYDVIVTYLDFLPFVEPQQPSFQVPLEKEHIPSEKMWAGDIDMM